LAVLLGKPQSAGTSACHASKTTFLACFSATPDLLTLLLTRKSHPPVDIELDDLQAIALLVSLLKIMQISNQKRGRKTAFKSEPSEQPLNDSPEVQFVNCLTGEIVVAALVENGRFWRADELDKSGRPHRRHRGELCQIVPATHGSYFTGSYAPLDPQREAEADPIRRKIFELRSEANRLKQELCTLYLVKVERHN
jgi:hypothetical protein